LKFLTKYYHILTSIFVFIIYLTTLAPTVVKIDSGELTTVQSTLGIAHPTGYPLFTIVGYLFTLIPLPFTDVYKLNLLCAIWCACSIGVFVYTVKHTLDNVQYFVPHKISKQIKKKKKQMVERSAVISLSENGKLIAAVFSGLLLAFSKTFWEQSTSVEVYSLHLFLVTHIIFFLIKAYTENTDKLLSKNWVLFVIFLALGFTNHMTTILILPGAVYLFFNKFGFNKKSLSKILISFLIFFFIIVILYSYLPIRASQNPILNWGNPVDFERIMRHISGKQYQVWLFSSSEAAKKQFDYFISSLPTEFSVSLLLSMVGLIYSFIYAKKFGIFILVTFVTTVLYSINYDINDIDSYFLLAYISIAFFSVFGIIKFLSLLKLKKFSHLVSIGVIALFILLQAYSNYGKVDKSNNYTYEDYAKTILGSVPKNAVIFTYQWDYFVSPSYYFEYVENFRKDVVVIDKELMRRSWYYNQVKHLHPEVVSGVRTEIDMFLNALKPFENGGKFDSNLLESIYRRLMTNLVQTNVEKRDFYVAPELFENEMQRGEFTLPEGYTLVPNLFLFKVVKGNNYIPASDPDFKIRFPTLKDDYLNNIEKLFICPMLIRRALYELKYDKTERAKVYIEKVKKDFPDFRIPLELEQVIK
jgi:Protein O-mannosyl-transferase TMEM260-like